MSAAAIRPNIRSPLILGGVLLVVFATAALLCVAIWQADAMPPAAAKAAAIAFFVFAVPFLVLTHELGHLGAAVAQGWRVPILAVGGFALRFNPLRFSAGRPAFADAAGAVVVVPPIGRGGRAGWIAVHAGGPAADLTMALLAGAAGLAAPQDSTAYAMFLTVAALAGLSCVRNLIPRRTSGGGGTDGLQILADLADSNAVSRGRHAQLTALMIDGVRPRDWDAVLVRAVEADSIWRGDVEGVLHAYSWHLDRGEIDAARAVLRRVGESGNESVLVEEAFLLAMLDGEHAAARRKLSRAQSWQTRRQPSYWRAEAAVALAEKDATALRGALHKWALACEDWVYTTDEEWDWHAKIEQRAGMLVHP